MIKSLWVKAAFAVLISAYLYALLDSKFNHNTAAGNTTVFTNCTILTNLDGTLSPENIEIHINN